MRAWVVWWGVVWATTAVRADDARWLAQQLEPDGSFAAAPQKTSIDTPRRPSSRVITDARAIFSSCDKQAIYVWRKTLPIPACFSWRGAVLS